MEQRSVLASAVGVGVGMGLGLVSDKWAKLVHAFEGISDMGVQEGGALGGVQGDGVHRLPHEAMLPLQNASTFGNDLEPTSYCFEVIFSIINVLSGLMLFTLLNGNIQSLTCSRSRGLYHTTTRPGSYSSMSPTSRSGSRKIWELQQGLGTSGCEMISFWYSYDCWLPF